jgi:hypothetical protein
LTKLTDAQRDALAYTELLARLPEALDNPWSLGCRIEEELARAEEDLTFLRTKARIAFHPARHLAVAEIDRPVDTRALFEACGTDRILELRSTSQGLYAALRVSSLSWFETTKGRFPERPNLDAVAARLQQGERAVGSWIAGSAEDPFPAVEFGARAEPGGFRSPAVKPIPTGQSPAAVVEAVLACL